MNGSYLVVAGRIRRELPDMERTVARAERSIREAKRTSDEAYVDSTALNMHSFYSGLERLFDLIANQIDAAPVTGENWHQELLRRMATEVPGVRPAVLSAGAVTLLDEYRGFRHVVRNAYAFNFNPVRIEALVQQLRPTFDRVHNELLDFANFLQTAGKD